MVNSGIQRAFNFAKPASVDLDVIEAEFTTNYLSYIHLIKAFLPFLMAKKSSAIACMSSGLALIPLSRCLNYWYVSFSPSLSIYMSAASWCILLANIVMPYLVPRRRRCIIS